MRLGGRAISDDLRALDQRAGVPVVTGHGMEGVVTAMWVVKIPAGSSLNAEKHLYEEIVYVLKGRGRAFVHRGRLS